MAVAPRPPIRRAGRLMNPVLWGGLAGLAAVGAAAVYVASRPSRPPVPATAKAAASPAPATAPQGLPRPADVLLEECADLAREHRFKTALDKLDWFPTRECTEAERGRLEAFRQALQARAAEFVAARTREAEALAAQGKLQDAASRLQDLADLSLPAVVGDAYLRLRRAAQEELKAKRLDSLSRTTAALADFAAQDRAARPAPDPEGTWKRAAGLMTAEKFDEALAELTALAALPEWRERALLARAAAHYAADRPLGVLWDAQLLLESGQAIEAAVDWLSRAIPRAAIDESVLRLFERLLAKNPDQPALWEGISAIWTWRHDVEEASRVYHDANVKGVRFDGPTAARLVQYAQLRHRGFPPGKPVVVDYAGPYEIFTDASPRRARELARQLEGIVTEYAAGFKRSVNPTFRFRVMLFSDDRDYQMYHKAIFGITARERGFGAYYSPSVKQLVVCDSSPEIRTIVRHEAFHQFLDYFVHDPPRWFNEGSASFFEQSTFGRPELDPKYQEGVRAGFALKQLPPLSELLTMPTATWVSDARESFFYCQAWSFIYWLHKQGKGSLWDEYLRLLIQGWPWPHAHQRVLAGKLAELEPAWQEAARHGRY